MQTIPDIEVPRSSSRHRQPVRRRFHQLWRRAETGDSEFMPVFLPWSIDPTYRAKLPDGFTMTAEEAELGNPPRPGRRADVLAPKQDQPAWLAGLFPAGVSADAG